MRKQILLIPLIILILCSLMTGTQQLSLLHASSFTETEWLIFWSTRVPRTVSLVIAGATASVCGLILQQLTQNRFVAPTTTGTTESAQVGILLVMLFMPTQSLLIRSAVAFVFAFLGTILFMLLLQALPRKSPLMVPLVGAMYGNIIGALVTFVAYQFQLIQNMTSWLQGNFSIISRGDYELLYLTIPVLLVLYMYARHFTIAGMGQEMASSLGLNYRRIQFVGLALIALATSITLITVGNLPFLGIVVPNLVALFYGDHLEKTLGITAMAGSIFLLFCDLIGRIIVHPYEIPVSLVAGVIGSLLFIGLLLKGGKR